MKKIYIKPDQLMMSNDGHKFRVINHASRVLYADDAGATEYRIGHKITLDSIPFIVRKKVNQTLYEFALQGSDWTMENMNEFSR